MGSNAKAIGRRVLRLIAKWFTPREKTTMPPLVLSVRPPAPYALQLERAFVSELVCSSVETPNRQRRVRACVQSPMYPQLASILTIGPILR